VKQFDSKYLDDMSGGDTEFVRDILSTFLETAQVLAKTLTDATLDHDFERAIYASHTLKGSARSVGAGPLGDLCEELEKLARNSDAQGYTNLAKHLPECFDELGTELAIALQPRAA
jgi:HPt (histidine-containing phosphotransfer) domain-containing protein